MNMETFATKICSVLERELGPGHRAEVKEVRKNNGVILHGLMVLSPGQNVAPTIYLDSFLEAYESGMPFDTVADKVLKVYKRDVPTGTIDFDFFRSFDAVRDGICYRLIRARGNEELLEGIPHVEFLDLAICFYYACQGGELGDGSILIHNSHMKMWDTSTAELHSLAQRNTPRLFPWVYRSLGQVIAEVTGDDAGLQDAESLPEMPMKVLTNVKCVQGAACILYPGVLETLAQREGCGFYIIPSSINEVILMPDNRALINTREIKQMIADVNSTQVAPEEVLSDSLYYYDTAQKRVNIIL